MLLSATFGSATAQSIALAPPQTEGGKPLMQALKERHTTRDFRRDALPPQLLSNLLWAAFGINRSGFAGQAGVAGRTAPSAHNAQEIEVYAVLADGAYRYDARRHALELVHAGDLRGLTGKQALAKDAPVSLVYVADLRRLSHDSESDALFYAAADAGHISQNVYLFAASEGLAAMTRAYIDRPVLSRALKLDARQRIILAQSVGYPK